jgi:hypothetical protein
LISVKSSGIVSGSAQPGTALRFCAVVSGHSIHISIILKILLNTTTSPVNLPASSAVAEMPYPCISVSSEGLCPTG